MNTLDENLLEIKRMLRRRKALLIITPLLFLGLSIAMINFITPKYESSATILVQNDETLSPALLYQMDFELEPRQNSATTSELEAFESFILSRSTIEKLIDVLELETTPDESGKRQLVNALRSQITTAQSSSDSYEISFEDTDPVRAKNAVEFLADEYITMKTTLDFRRADETVAFFTQRLSELEDIIDQQRGEMVNSTSAQIKALPVNTQALQRRLEDVNTQIDNIDWQVYQLEGQESYLTEFLDQAETNFSVSPLYRLPLTEIPYGEELTELLDEYDVMSDSYTESYPQLRQLRSRIVEVVRRIPGTIESTKARLSNQRLELVNQRNQVINNMERSYVAEQQNTTRQSSFSVYQELYNDMKVKLEQAQFTSQLSEKSLSKYAILDAPQIADAPSSPNRNLLIAAGLILGLFMGGLMGIVAELLDNTVRSEKDFLIDKPVIAYLSDGRA